MPDKQPEALRIAAEFESFAIDHAPDGWPAIRQRDLTNASITLRAQHAAIQRKDALLRRAAVHLSRIAMAAGAPTPPGVNVGWIAHYAEQAEKELRKELSQ